MIRIKKGDIEVIIRPARSRPKEAVIGQELAIHQPLTHEELARRQALVAQILTRRKERVIAPQTTSDLVRKAREQEKK